MVIDGVTVDLGKHFTFRNLSNLSEVNKFYKTMLDGGVKIIDDGDAEFIYSLL